jgi:hypothetical protein
MARVRSVPAPLPQPARRAQRAIMRQLDLVFVRQRGDWLAGCNPPFNITIPPPGRSLAALRVKCDGGAYLQPRAGSVHLRWRMGAWLDLNIDTAALRQLLAPTNEICWRSIRSAGIYCGLKSPDPTYWRL